MIARSGAHSRPLNSPTAPVFNWCGSAEAGGLGPQAETIKYLATAKIVKTLVSARESAKTGWLCVVQCVEQLNAFAIGAQIGSAATNFRLARPPFVIQCILEENK